MAEHRAVESLKRTFEFCSTTYYSTVPVICTQTRIHRTQSLHYDKSLKQGSPRYIVTTNFAATIYHGDMSFRFARYRCSKFSLDRYVGEISRRLYRLITRLCPLSVHKHEFIVHSRFSMINRWSKVHHDISLQRTSLQWYIMVICRFALRDIVAANSR